MFKEQDGLGLSGESLQYVGHGYQLGCDLEPCPTVHSIMFARIGLTHLLIRSPYFYLHKSNTCNRKIITNPWKTILTYPLIKKLFNPRSVGWNQSWGMRYGSRGILKRENNAVLVLTWLLVCMVLRKVAFLPRFIRRDAKLVYGGCQTV